MNSYGRFLLLTFGLLLLWQLVVMLTGVPHYILPGPLRVMQAITGNWTFLLQHLMITLAEIMAGLFLGILLGTATALIMYVSPLLKRWMLPVLVISQAIPVFALAPLLVLWLGYGMASKIAMAILIIYFPVTSSLFNGMNKTQPELLELARVMDATTLSSLRYIVLPSALPGFAAGARVAAAVAPIGAVIGEWVGSSSGLGYYMLHANARMQVDVMFAALAMLVVLALGIYYFVDWALEKLIYW